MSKLCCSLDYLVKLNFTDHILMPNNLITKFSTIDISLYHSFVIYILYSYTKHTINNKVTIKARFILTDYSFEKPAH